MEINLIILFFDLCECDVTAIFRDVTSTMLLVSLNSPAGRLHRLINYKITSSARGGLNNEVRFLVLDILCYRSARAV